ncbi:MAG: hypothetical protein Tsb0027_01090 [Wenzhouxiangellaceae bacterium]
MDSKQPSLFATLVISALALGCSASPISVNAQDDSAKAVAPEAVAPEAVAEIQELTNFTWTVQYCQDPAQKECSSYRNMEPGDEFQVRNVSGSKDATLILVKHSTLGRYEFKAAIKSLNDNQLVLNFDDKTLQENSCKQLTVNLIKEHGQNRNPGNSCAEQLKDAGLKMSEKQLAANCAHDDVMNWSIVSTGATPPNCLTASSEFRGFHAMSPPDPGEGSGTGRN